MSQRNVEIMRALAEKWNAGERDHSLMTEYFDPSIELESPFSSVTGEPYRGHAGMDQWILDVDEQFAQWHLELEEVLDAGDAVVTIGGVSGRGRASGIIVEFPAATVAHFAADHRITRIRIYLDTLEALRAVGLAG